MRGRDRHGFAVVLFALVLLVCLLASAGCGTQALGSGSESSPVSSETPGIPSLKSTTTQRATVTSRLVDRSASTTAPEPSATNAQPVEPGTPHAWALAASAVLTHFNGDQDDLLGGTGHAWLCTDA